MLDVSKWGVFKWTQRCLGVIRITALVFYAFYKSYNTVISSLLSLSMSLNSSIKRMTIQMEKTRTSLWNVLITIFRLGLLVRSSLCNSAFVVCVCVFERSWSWQCFLSQDLPCNTMWPDKNSQVMSYDQDVYFNCAPALSSFHFEWSSGQCFCLPALIEEQIHKFPLLKSHKMLKKMLHEFPIMVQNWHLHYGGVAVWAEKKNVTLA